MYTWIAELTFLLRFPLRFFKAFSMVIATLAKTGDEQQQQVLKSRSQKTGWNLFARSHVWRKLSKNFSPEILWRSSPPSNLTCIYKVWWMHLKVSNAIRWRPLKVTALQLFLSETKARNVAFAWDRHFAAVKTCSVILANFSYKMTNKFCKQGHRNHMFSDRP